MITDTSCLSAKAQEILALVDKLIDSYRYKPGHSKTIELWSNDYDTLKGSIGHNLHMDLKTETYRGYKFTSKEKRARYSKRNFNKVFK